MILPSDPVQQFFKFLKHVAGKLILRMSNFSCMKCNLKIPLYSIVINITISEDTYFFKLVSKRYPILCV